MPEYSERFQNPQVTMSEAQWAIKQTTSLPVKRGYASIYHTAKRAKRCQELDIHAPLYTDPNSQFKLCTCSLFLEQNSIEKTIGHLDRTGHTTPIFIYRSSEPDGAIIAICQDCNATAEVKDPTLSDYLPHPSHALEHTPTCASWRYRMRRIGPPIAIAGMKVVEDDMTRWFVHCYLCKETPGQKYLEWDHPRLKEELAAHFAFHAIDPNE